MNLTPDNQTELLAEYRKQGKKSRHEEENLQIRLMDWIRFRYPKVLAIHVPNGGKRSASEGYRFKKLGVVPGVPDILVIRSRAVINLQTKQFTTYHGLAIELKAPGRIKNVSVYQNEVMKKLTEEGWKCHVCDSYESAKQAVDLYLNL